MKNSKNEKLDIKTEAPTLSTTTKQRVEKKVSNTTNSGKSTSFTLMIISGIFTSLFILALTAASFKLWRPILFPELKKIQSLEKDIITLNQEMLALQNDAKNKELLSNELKSLKTEFDQTKTDIQVEIAGVNDKINTIASEQKDSKVAETTQLPTQGLDQTLDDVNRESIDVDGSVFYAKFLTAIEEKKPLLQFYEQASKLNLSEEFKNIIGDIKEINFEKVKSDEELSYNFNQMNSEILKDTMIKTTSQKGKKNLIGSITANIQVTDNHQPNRTQLKADFITARQLYDQGDIESTIEKLKPYEHHKNVGSWIKHAKERLSHDNAIQNVRGFKGPYSK